MNPVSFRTKNENLLRTKTKSFKDNIKQSQARIRSSSSLNNLAVKLYSTTVNTQFTPNKGTKLESLNLSRNKSISKINSQDMSFNPQAIDGLQLRTYHVPCFAELNTNLLKQKKMLQTRIASLKQAIALEQRTLNRSDTNAKKNQAGYSKFNQMYNEAHRKSLNLQNEMSNTNGDNNNLKRDIRNLRRNIADTQNQIKNQTQICSNLNTEIKNLKTNYMQQEKQKTNLKAQLMKQQKVMSSYSVQNKGLEDERAMLLVEINQSVKSFKL